MDFNDCSAFIFPFHSQSQSFEVAISSDKNLSNILIVRDRKDILFYVYFSLMLLLLCEKI